ncbi:MAG: hypothetical protein JXM70_04325 [Pirellulales bacterium]|nr:hypothetical protein [Pirellulales bacterium]
MKLKFCLYAVVIPVVALQTAMLSAQQITLPGNQPGQNALTVERLPRLPSRLPQPEPVEYRVGQRYDQPGYQNMPVPQPRDEQMVSPAATDGAQLEQPPSVLDGTKFDDVQFDEEQAVDLATETASASGLRDFWGYRYNMSSLDWIVGAGNQFGMFSLNNDHYQRSGLKSGIGVGLDFNFVSGPVESEMPPRLYDFSLAYQHRQQFGDFAYDVAASVMASSDFEGSAREGIRYPAHAVGFLRVHPAAELVFGVDYLDRGDIKLLPVAGMIWIPNDDVRFELVFPRPRVTFALPMFICPKRDCEEDCSPITLLNHKERRLYIAGDLGGGTWAVERGGMYDDLSTYRDLRLSIGLECVDENGSRSAFEVGYLFERRLEFTSGNGNMRLDDTAMIRWIGSY